MNLTTNGTIYTHKQPADALVSHTYLSHIQRDGMGLKGTAQNIQIRLDHSKSLIERVDSSDKAGSESRITV